MATPHNQAEKGQIAKTVLMPGDPLRAKFIADHFLDNPVQFNSVRNILGFTGTYEGHPVSVMASGMGMPSIGIYSYELYNFFGVETIIRIGSAGGMHPDLKLFDIVLGQGACTNSAYFSQYGISGNFAPIADYATLKRAVEECEKRNLNYKVGNILSSDVFYSEKGIDGTMEWAKLGVLAVEMEAAALYMNAARAGKKALAMCTISDLLIGGAVTTADERQTAFHDMMQVALTIAE